VGRFCEQTELNGESHATLLMGPHNTGKSLVLNTVLRDLHAKTGNKPVGTDASLSRLCARSLHTCCVRARARARACACACACECVLMCNHCVACVIVGQ
jgi:hypothetical protein